MRLTLFLALSLLTACGGGTSSSFKMGKTTRSEIVAKKGEPDKEVDLPVKDGKMMVYEATDEKYQLEGEIVMNAFKAPNENEKLLLHWKHKFKDCKTSSVKLPQLAKSHTPPEIELGCPEMGQSVIYTEGSDSVSRVVEYAKK